MGRAIYSGIYEPGHPTANAQGFRKDVLELVRGPAFPPSAIRAISCPPINGGRDRPAKVTAPCGWTLVWRSRESNQVGINEFAGWAKDAGIEMMLALNGTRGIEDARNSHRILQPPPGTY